MVPLDDSVPPDADLPSDTHAAAALHRDQSGSSLATTPDEEDQKLGWRVDPCEFQDIKPDQPLDLARHRTARSEVPNLARQRTLTALGGLIKLRPDQDDEENDWWFASTAIPLIVATFAPMANMLSIAALVVTWRENVTDFTPVNKYSTATPYPDPKWCIDLNAASLVCGFVGNIFLLCNFTRKIRYILALPVSIILFFLACGILTGILAAMHIYQPASATQVYSQGYWHGILASILYLLCAILLMINMMGYFLGHYNQHFELTDEQRNLILQTMIFFLWLAGGAAVFTKLEKGNGWTYPDALYFCDVTVLTIGFGDYYATNDLGRGLVFPFSVGGTIILGLMVSSIHGFAQELSKENVVKKHIETRRVNTLSRAVTEESQISANGKPISSATIISRPLEAEKIQDDLDEKAKLDKVRSRTIGFHESTKEEQKAAADAKVDYDESESEPAPSQFRFAKDVGKRGLFRTLTLERVISASKKIPLSTRSQKAILMKDEKDRFDRMRQIQYEAARFRKWYALTMSIIAFSLLWCVGALVFHFCEATTQRLTYFQSLYFCYVSLLTIGYGDLSPKSNAGKAFFVLWSLIAVPTMTILVSDLGDTVIGGFKRSVLKYGGLAFLGKGRGWGLDWFTRQKNNFQRRLSGVGIGHEKAPALEAQTSVKDDEQDVEVIKPMTIEQLAGEELSEPQMMRKLAYALRTVADDMKNDHYKRYTYEEWVEYSRLIRFTRVKRTNEDQEQLARQLEIDEMIDGVVDWDWLDNKSPMTSEQSESEWLLDRLLESLLRSFRKADVLAAMTNPHHNHDNEHRLPARMSIFHAQRHTSVASSHDRPPSRSGRISSSINAAAAALATGNTDLVHDDSESEDHTTWSKRGQAKVAARQARRRSAAMQTASIIHRHHSRTSSEAARPARTETETTAVDDIDPSQRVADLPEDSVWPASSSQGGAVPEPYWTRLPSWNMGRRDSRERQGSGGKQRGRLASFKYGGSKVLMLGRRK